MIIDQLFENNKKPLNEVDPRNFDSDEDYYAAVNAPAKPRYRGQQSPGVNPDDEDYFREIFRKKRLAAQQAERSADHARLATGTNESGMEEGQRWPDSSNSLAKRSAVATNLKGAPSKAGRGSGMTVATRVEPTITSTRVQRKDDRPIPSFLQKEMTEGEQLDELSFKDIQRGARNISKGAQKFTKNVADTGAAIGGAARDVGGAIKQVGKTAIADPVSATYNATKGGLNKAADVAKGVYGDVKAGAQKVGGAVDTVSQDVGDTGTWAGNKIKQAGRGVANVAGGTAGALGATVGGATTGVGRAAAKGFNTGVQNVGGDAVERMQTNIMKQIDAKKTEIAGLEKELSQVSAQAPAAPTNSITDQGGAINPTTGSAYTPDEVDAWLDAQEVKRELLPKIKADLGATPRGGYDLGQAAEKMLTKPTATLPQATAPGAPSKVSYGQGFNKPAAPKPTSVPNYGSQAPGYNYTTSVTPTATPSTPKLSKDEYINRIMATNESTQTVAETVRQVKRMMETVTSKADVQRIKDYIDYHMGTNLNENARIKRNRLLSEVTQLAATRRREIASRLA